MTSTMILKLLPVLTLIALVGCEAELNQNDLKLVAEIGFDADTALRIKTHGDSLKRFQGLNDEHEPTDVDGLLVSTSTIDAYETLRKLRDELVGSGYAAYIYDLGFGFGPDRIAVVPYGNDYEYLAAVRLSGINYDISHEDVIARYKEWDEKYDLDLLGANFEWLEAEIAIAPESWMQFAKRVYAFCPDVVDQGTGTVAALAKEMERSGRLYLWWD